MINEIINILKSKNIYGWNLKEVSKKTYELYFIRQDLDMNRSSDVIEYYVTLFTLNKNNKVGKSTFQLYNSMTIDEISDKIDSQIELSKLALSNFYNLPKQVEVRPLKKDKEFDKHTLKESAFIVADALFEADKYDKGYINSSEIYIIDETEKYVDSNNNNFDHHNTFGQVEFITSWKDEGEEIELYKFIEFDDLDANHITSEVDKMLVEASNRSKAKPTPSLSDYKLKVSDENAKFFFEHFIHKTCVDDIYQNLSNYDIGTKIQNMDDECDKLSIHLDPFLKGSTKSRYFDNEGISLRKINLFEKGKVVSLFGSNAKSQYLNKPINGNVPNMIIEKGTLSKEELEETNYIDVVSFSGFDIDPITGEFGSEIRLAYLYQKGKERQIITGGSVSGNVENAIKTIRFANNIVYLNNYCGPEYVLIDNVKFNSK